MARYLVTYHGGGMPGGDEARQQAMAAFGAWVASVGSALIDPGAPLGDTRTVSGDGVDVDPVDGRASGYSILEAPGIDAAVDLVRAHPFVARGGALQVHEAVAL
ncbi:MAG: hypothetical protein ACRD12_22655 [Acidimicrobiales bacterium]